MTGEGKSGAPTKMDDVGEMAFQIGKWFTDLKRTHVQPTERTHVGPTINGESAGELSSVDREPLSTTDGALESPCKVLGMIRNRFDARAGGNKNLANAPSALLENDFFLLDSTL